MGRAGRYTLSVMAWVAAYAGWSSIIGLVVAALTGDRPRSVSAGMSALLTVIGPLVPTLVALWFNDWARDGFPSREQQRAARAANAAPDGAEPPASTAPEGPGVDAGSGAAAPDAGRAGESRLAAPDAAGPLVDAGPPPADRAPQPVPATVAAPPAGSPAAPPADSPAAAAYTAPAAAPYVPPTPPAPPTVAAHPLGVPPARAGRSTPEGAFPVAPLLRDGD